MNRRDTYDRAEALLAQRQHATVLVDGEEITGTVYNVRDNGWPCVETPDGRVASGPRLEGQQRELLKLTASAVTNGRLAQEHREVLDDWIMNR
jgi:hypothetical protein